MSEKSKVTCSGGGKVHLVDESEIESSIIMPDTVVKICEDCAALKERKDRENRGIEIMNKLAKEAK